MKTPTAADSPGQGHRSRRFSGRLFRYVLQDFLIILACTVAAFMVLFLFAALHDDLSDLTRYHADFAQIALYFMLLMPQYLSRVLPMSMLLAAVYVVVNLCRHNEMTAMRASGLSLIQSTLPIFAVALVMVGVHGWVAEDLAPRSQRQATALFERLTEDPEKANDLPPVKSYLTYRNRADMRDWLFRDFAVDEPSRGVMVTQLGKKGQMVWELRAEQVSYDKHGWLFEHGVFTQYDARGEFFARPPETFERLRARDKMDVLGELTEDPTRLSFLAKLKVVETMSVYDIFHVLGEPETMVSADTRSVLMSYLVYRLVFPFSCLLAVLVGIPLSVTTERGTAMRSFVLAAGVMVAYFLSAEVFLIMGKSHVLPPLVAGGLPTLVFMIWGLRIFLRKQ